MMNIVKQETMGWDATTVFETYIVFSQQFVVWKYLNSHILIFYSWDRPPWVIGFDSDTTSLNQWTYRIKQRNPRGSTAPPKHSLTVQEDWEVEDGWFKTNIWHYRPSATDKFACDHQLWMVMILRIYCKPNVSSKYELDHFCNNPAQNQKFSSCQSYCY